MANHAGDNQGYEPQQLATASPNSGQTHSSKLAEREEGEIEAWHPPPQLSSTRHLHRAATRKQKEVQQQQPVSLKPSDVNERDELDRTRLIVAARMGDEKKVQILLENKETDLNAKARGGITALHVASFCGHARVVQQLLGKNSQLQETLKLLHARASEEKFTALHMAACSSDESTIRAVWEAYKLATLSKVQLKDAVNAKDCIGWTPLHHAAWLGCTVVVSEILSWKLLDVNMVDGDGFTALHLATWQGHVDVVTLILNHQDEEDVSDVQPNKKARANTRTRAHISTLQQDVDWENLPRPELANYTLKEERSQITPLHYAVEQDQDKVVIVLLENPNTDVHLKNSDNKSAFDMAVERRSRKILWELLGNYREEKFDYAEKLRNALSNRGYKNFIPKGQDSREKRLNNCGELLKSAFAGSRYDDIFFLIKEMESWLIDVNKKIEQSGKKDVSLLHHAAFAGLEKLVDILVNIPNMEVNFEDSDEQTPLHYAAVAGHANVVKVLIANPACRANAEDKFERTALQVAVESGKHDVEKLLLERSDVRDYVDRFYRNRQVYVDAANAMLLGAALIASVTYAGWLQPPAGFTPYDQLEVPGTPGTSETFASVEQHMSTRVFWIFNSLSFFFSIATVIAGAGAVLPTLDVFIKQEVRLVKRTLVATSTLLVFSVVFILGAFGAAGYASLPPVAKYERIMTSTVIPGALLCMISMVWFLKRLYGIRPSWWRKCEQKMRPHKHINEKRHSARFLFSKPRPD